jgi:hypothetical protein
MRAAFRQGTETTDGGEGGEDWGSEREERKSTRFHGFQAEEMMIS